MLTHVWLVKLRPASEWHEHFQCLLHKANDASCRNATNGVSSKLYVLAGVHKPFRVKMITGKGVGKVHDNMEHRLKTLKKKKTLVQGYISTDNDETFLINLLGPTQGACRTSLSCLQHYTALCSP